MKIYLEPHFVSGILARDEQRNNMRISVTQRLIAMGRKKIAKEGDAPCNCPVACAISKAVGTKVTVCGFKYYFARWGKGSKTVEVSLPAAACAWIVRFDGVGPISVKPFRFNLKVK